MNKPIGTNGDYDPAMKGPRDRICDTDSVTRC